MRSRLSRLALDRPNQRSLHQTPVPRTGGIGIHVGVLLAWAMARPNLPSSLWIALAVLLAVSFLDDLRGVPTIGRLAAHLIIAGAVAASLVLGDYGVIGVVVAAFALAWMTNLYNFMDGSDGLAGGMAAFGFVFYGIAAWLAGSTAFALLNFSVAAAAAAFLVFNFHPARIFMGDVGSVPLGFLAAAFGIIGWLQRDWSWWFPLLVFSPFIADASMTLMRRLLSRERVWEAHRDHYYQRLVQLGWGHRRTALAEYALMLVCGVVALIALSLPTTGQIIALVMAIALYLALIAKITIMWVRFKTGNMR
jgi:UDP-N-acetylmuramyl pentapeptide phosphotransferase/UDP-N-acetylglucosamine-1-phosphate transferase